MSETPIYDHLVWMQRTMGSVGPDDEIVPTYRIGDKVYLGRPPLAQAMQGAGEKMRDAFRMMTASGGSSSQEVSASSASRHSLPDSSRPESLVDEVWDLEAREAEREAERRRSESPIGGWVRKGKSYAVGVGVRVEVEPGQDFIWVGGHRYARIELEDMSSEEMRALFQTGKDPRPLEKVSEYVDWDEMTDKRLDRGGM